MGILSKWQNWHLVKNAFFEDSNSLIFSPQSTRLSEQKLEASTLGRKTYHRWKKKTPPVYLVVIPMKYSRGIIVRVESQSKASLALAKMFISK